MDTEIVLKKILVPTDFSDSSHLAFRHAAAISHWSGSELLVVHVVEKFMDHSLLYSDVWPFQKPLEGYYRDLEESTARKLTERVRSEVGPDVHFRVLVTTGVPSTEILSIADREHVDLIVISTHGRSGIALALLGSTTDRVLRKARCPVLVVRSGDHGFVK